MQQGQKSIVAGDMLFPEGGYQLRANGKQALNQYVPQLQGLHNARLSVYGYTGQLAGRPRAAARGICQ